MRYVEITHVYVLPVAAEDVDSIDAVANAGVGMMERFMKRLAANIRDLHSDWKLMPIEYQPDDVTFTPARVPTKEEFGDMASREHDRITSLKMIEADVDQGISFTGDVMGQVPKITHPWDQKLRIFPPDDDRGRAETEAIRREGLLCGAVNPNDLGQICVGIKGHETNHLWAPAAEVIDGGREIEP